MLMNAQKIKSMFFKIFILSSIVFSYPFLSHALTISPPRLELQGKPGETIKKEITLTNDQKTTQLLYVSFANFEASGETGNPSFVEPTNDLGTWISSEQSVAMRPGESKIVPISIKIPKDAEPGGHFAAVFFGTTPPHALGVSIGAKIGTLILLSVAGDVKEKAGLIEFSTKDHKIFYNTLPVSFFYRFKNDGGDRVKPIGKIRMHDLFYIPEDSIDANPSSGNILPGSIRRFEIEWVKQPRPKDYVMSGSMIAQFFDQALYQWHNFAIGPYFAKMDLVSGVEASHTIKTVFFFVFPWQLVICLLMLISILYGGGKKVLKRYNRYIIEKMQTNVTPSNDSHSG